MSTTGYDRLKHHRRVRTSAAAAVKQSQKQSGPELLGCVREMRDR
ncbi:MAG: hypothetical protein AAGE65_06860 [Planctomycetota bacterium]